MRGPGTTIRTCQYPGLRVSVLSYARARWYHTRVTVLSYTRFGTAMFEDHHTSISLLSHAHSVLALPWYALMRVVHFSTGKTMIRACQYCQA